MEGLTSHREGGMCQRSPTVGSSPPTHLLGLATDRLEEETYKSKAVMEPGGSGQGSREITWGPYGYRCPPAHQGAHSDAPPG